MLRQGLEGGNACKLVVPPIPASNTFFVVTGVSTGKDTLSLFASPIAVLQCSLEFLV